MEGIDRSERTGVGLPVKMSEWESGHKTRREEFVDVVGIVIFDCRPGHISKCRGGDAKDGGAFALPGEPGSGISPVTFDVERGCSIVKSATCPYSLADILRSFPGLRCQVRRRSGCSTPRLTAELSYTARLQVRKAASV